VFIVVVVYFVIDSVRKLLGSPSYLGKLLGSYLVTVLLNRPTLKYLIALVGCESLRSLCFLISKLITKGLDGSHFV
jgi:hypothetical protein